MDFTQPPGSSLTPNHQQDLDSIALSFISNSILAYNSIIAQRTEPINGDVQLQIVDEGDTQPQEEQKGEYEGEFKTFPGLLIPNVDVVVGVAVDYQTEVNGIQQLREKLKKFQEEKEKNVVMVIVIDGLEVLNRNEDLKKYFLGGEDRKQVLEHFRKISTRLNFEEKKSARNNLNETDSALVFYPESVTDSLGESLTIFTVIKPRMRGKLHTDLWLFAGFAQFFQSEYVCLIDPEINPEELAIGRLYERLGKEPEDLLGVFAAPEVDTSLHSFTESDRVSSRSCGNRLVSIAMKLLRWADWFEILYSQMMYTPLENLGGYISYPAVRFVMYRWQTLRRNARALSDYFKPLIAGQQLSWLDNNLYEFVPGLFLCLRARLFTENTYFAFDSKAIGVWRMPSKLTRWIDYRARVMNANFLGFLKAIAYTPSFCTRIKLSWRTFGVMCEFYFFAIAFLFKWLAIGIFYVLSSIAVRKLFPVDTDDNDCVPERACPNPSRLLEDNDVQGKFAQEGLGGVYIGWKYAYLVSLMVIFFMSLGKLGDKAKYIWFFLITLNICQSIFNFLILFLNIIENNADSEATKMTYAAIAVMLIVLVTIPIGTCLYGVGFKKILRFVWNGGVYLLLLPVYTNVLTIYSICNTSDDCWGLSVTSNSHEKNNIRSVYSVNKNLFLIFFIIMNIVFGVTWEQLDINTAAEYRSIFLSFYFIGVLVIALPVGPLQVILKIVQCCKRTPRREGEDETNQLRNRAMYSTPS